ncbi:methylated-DNA--[protein]-cysteine S-methyltransferase [Pseudidiomarina halophila]|uniref:methylated-DNA--[protein]-cysteine S-methyltransferase n=1 Tax=Pseudidiomarina halophila TaxID=1449799 RepID=UPI0018E517DF|nr:methylated-DNA--[protein]-cysteine S-methyltransferase [Pseudidiomarina halophila]
MNTIYQASIDSELGPVAIYSDGEAITAVSFVQSPVTETKWCPILREAAQQLTDYFDGSLRIFDLPLRPQGTEFQERVWQTLQRIPFGKLASYADVANAIENPKAVRAVGMANSKNPIGIVVPCHRVIGANGTLTGYAGGLDKKSWLLRHEGCWPTET